MSKIFHEKTHLWSNSSTINISKRVLNQSASVYRTLYHTPYIKIKKKKAAKMATSSSELQSQVT